MLNAFREIPRSDPFTISPQFTVRPHDAGHILGSSSLELTITENGKKTVVLFSGDIGRYDQPILKDPEAPPRCDVLLCESTYGDRDHPADSPEDALADVVNRVAKRGGVIVIPAFAVGRTQTIMYIIRKLENANRIPRLPVYVDSPMAISVTGLYLRHHEDHDLTFTAEENNGNPLDAHTVHYMRTVDDSKKINDVRTPAIIISASGMATGGRVLHHIAQRAPDRAKRDSAGRLSGRRHARPRARGWRENAPHVRQGCAGRGGSHQSAAIFGARRKKRIDALAHGSTGAAAANISRPWRACSFRGAQTHHRNRFALARVITQLPADRGSG